MQATKISETAIVIVRSIRKPDQILKILGYERNQEWNGWPMNSLVLLTSKHGQKLL